MLFYIAPLGLFSLILSFPFFGAAPDKSGYYFRPPLLYDAERRLNVPDLSGWFTCVPSIFSASSLLFVCFFSAFSFDLLPCRCRVWLVFYLFFLRTFFVFFSSRFRVIFESFSRLTANCVYAISGSGRLR